MLHNGSIHPFVPAPVSPEWKLVETSNLNEIFPITIVTDTPIFRQKQPVMESQDTRLILRRLETYIYTYLSWFSLDAFMSCLGSSLVAPCLVLALSHDCLGVS